MFPSKRRIAVVDDEPSVSRAIKRLIRSAGMDVDTFSSGAEFLRALADRAPDCVVLDMHMPELTGSDVQARLAQLGSKVPVVIITGHDVPEARARAMAAGARAYLLKPVDDMLLLGAIADAVLPSQGPA
jgi:FixJ family two-component response regulator